MIEQYINDLFQKLHLGKVILPVETVSGGFMHRMYKVRTSEKIYAVKYLNPNIMARADAISNFQRAEALEKIIEDAKIPIVPALIFDNRKMQNIDGQFFYIFDWHEGKITDWNHITNEQCYAAGSILGSIHAIESKTEKSDVPESHIDWEGYLSKARNTNVEIANLLEHNLQLLSHAENEVNKARKALPDFCCISDEDMDPKNVMWENGKPYVIDLECLDYGNPVSHVLQLSLQWAGITTCNLDLKLTKSFFKGYLEAYDNGFRAYDKVFGLAYTWIEWLEYNLNRALGNCMDDAEKSMGVSEVKNTLNRMRYIYEHEKEILSVLQNL